MSQAKRALTQQLAAANVPTYQQISILQQQAGGIEKVGCTEKDFYNAERNKRMELAGFDATMLNEYFQTAKEKNPAFTFNIKSDKVTKKFTHCFWADATSRKAYEYYGDVVVFDTTYNTNRYALIFAPFFGVNNHGQTTLFGCAFLSDETAETFEWLLEEWLSAMPAGPPKMIITDQDAAMTKAIGKVMPQTTHRYCMWHIVNKFSEKLNAASYKEYYEEFRKCIWNTENPEEFGKSWFELVKKSNLSDNDWLKQLYGLREMWIPAYVNGVFSAGMTSSQRAESSHSFFKRYVPKNNSLMDFIFRFSWALKRIRHAELGFDHKDINEQPTLKTAIVMEK